MGSYHHIMMTYGKFKNLADIAAPPPDGPCARAEVRVIRAGGERVSVNEIEAIACLHNQDNPNVSTQPRLQSEVLIVHLVCFRLACVRSFTPFGAGCLVQRIFFAPNIDTSHTCPCENSPRPTDRPISIFFIID